VTRSTREDPFQDTPPLSGMHVEPVRFLVKIPSGTGVKRVASKEITIGPDKVRSFHAQENVWEVSIKHRTGLVHQGVRRFQAFAVFRTPKERHPRMYLVLRSTASRRDDVFPETCESCALVQPPLRDLNAEHSVRLSSGRRVVLELWTKHTPPTVQAHECEVEFDLQFQSKMKRRSEATSSASVRRSSSSIATAPRPTTDPRTTTAASATTTSAPTTAPLAPTTAPLAPTTAPLAPTTNTNPATSSSSMTNTLDS
jgi:hypothetical protein